MNFRIENGANHISIEINELGDYFRFDAPLSVTWAYSGGTVGKYFCALPHPPEYRQELLNKLRENLNRDFTGRTEELHSVLAPLFSLFKNGEYKLEYYDGKAFFGCKSSHDNFAEMHYWPVQIVFGEEVDVKRTEQVKKEYDDWVQENRLTKKYAESSLFDYTTPMLYDGSSDFFATEPYNVINEDRVAFFEKSIGEGQRPLVIVMVAWVQNMGGHSSYYVLDGHHKLLAYQKLNIHPPIALITQNIGTLSESDFDFETLSTMLYPWQTRAILDDWDERDDYLRETLKRPDSPLHQFVKAGVIKTYHENKKLKSEGFYIVDRPHGKLSEWYDNGRLKHRHYYKNGVRNGTWEDYYPSGKIQYIQPFNNRGAYDGELISYYENGQVRWSKNVRDGKDVDDSYQSWFENGDPQAELTYDKKGMLIERKDWDVYGQLVNHEVYDEEQKKLIKQPKSEKISPEVLKKILAQTRLYDVSAQSKPKDLGIIRERQYPKTNSVAVFRIVLLVLLMLLALLRLCKQP